MRLVLPCAFILLAVFMFTGTSFGPRITDASVEPVKVRPGDTMMVTATVEDDYRISSVTADMGGIETIELELVEGTIYQGVWQKQWLVHDTETKDYTTTITATNRLGLKTTAEVEWSDPDGPTFANPQFNETSIDPNEVVRFNVTVTDVDGVDTVIATFRYPNATEANRTLVNVSDVYYYDWTDTFAGGTYNVTYIWANDTLGNANDTTYTDVSFTVTEEIDVTLYGVPIDFDSLNPGDTDKNATVGYGFPMNVTIESTTNVEINLTLKGDANFTTGVYNFPIGNLSYCNTSSSSESTAMAASYPSTPPYADWKDIPVPTADTNRSVYFWISIPTGQEAGTYSATVTVKVEST